jgi:putative Ca2+/H+ antiporter (TMEM165/GDT1 family)
MMAVPPPFPTDHPAPPPGRKSVLVAVVLALVFGPFGLFYVSTPAALFTLFLAVVLGLFTVGVGLIPVWLLCVVWAFVAAQHQAAGPDGPAA